MTDSAPRRSLTWKYEDGLGGDDNDVGPAWIADSDGETEQVNGGDWITRREARALAAEHGYAFFEDADQLGNAAATASSTLDIDETNRKLRAAGVSESELRIADSGFDDIEVWGTMLRLLPEFTREADSPFTTAMVSMSDSDAVAALDLLVPEWRSAESSG